MRFASSLVGGFGLCLALSALQSQESLAQAPAAEVAAKQGTDAQAAIANFQALNAKWAAMDQDLVAFDKRFREAPREEQLKLKDEFIRMIEGARQFMPMLQQAALEAYKAAPNQDAKVIEVLLGVTADAVRRDDYDAAKAICDLLLANKCATPGFNNLAGMTAYCTDNYEQAEVLLTAAKKENAIAEEGLQFLNEIATAKKLFAVEAVLRQKEAQADDLPRVKLETSKGVIVLELFENEAPEAVGNFVNLVEKGYYNGLTFHRVLAGFMAQGGCPRGTGTGGPGYKIRCECEKPEHRNHFRGTLSMAHAGKDTGGSQFFLTFLRTPHLDGRHTAFGRVVEGMEVLTKLQRRDPNEGITPDKIVKAEVIRKREHKYVPTKVE